MKITGNSSGGDSFIADGSGIPERLAGKAVLDVILEGVPLGRISLSVRVAAMLEQAVCPEERRGYENFPRLILKN